jgi:Domain of unknown function (DUF3427)
VCGFEEAAHTLGTQDLWKASEYVIAAEPTPLHFELEVPPKSTEALTFCSGNGTEQLKFASLGHLDRQTLRGVRELDPGSAAELDKLLLTSQEGVRALELFEDYSREDVHDIFSPETPFVPQGGTWGLHGIVAIPDRPGDFVFFVTLGQQQGGHVFDEGVTQDGVLSWQSQPRQGLDDPRVRTFIQHDELKNSIYLFLRASRRAKYTYLGKLKYLSHDAERENPVYFQWQILD